MLNAFVLGAVSQLSLILSGLTVFLVSVPKRLVGALAADLAATGWNWRRVAALRSWVVLACGIASVMGYGGASVVSAVHGARMASFASGGILAMLSNSLIPFAHERSKSAGFWTGVASARPSPCPERIRLFAEECDPMA